MYGIYILGGIKDKLSIKSEKEREREEINKGPRTKHVHGVMIITTLILAWSLVLFDAQEFMESSELLGVEGFSNYISYVVMGIDVIEDDFLGLDMLVKKMVFDINCLMWL